MASDSVIPVINAGPGWLVVDKPENMSVHNEPGRDLVSLLRLRLESDSDLAKRTAYDSHSVIGPVHRLDRETSGVMILGLTPDICRMLTRQFEERTITKHYTALVHGEFEAVDGPLSWTWPLTPGAEGRNNPAGKGKKVACKTRVRVLDRSVHYTLIECELLTGRKHQIRRHAKLSGHPVLGDTRYGSKRAVDFIRQHVCFDRLALHSCSLSLRLPGGGEPDTFTSPVPREFLTLLENDKKS